MDAARQLFDFLGNPKGQVVIYLTDSTEGQKEIVVWVRQGYDRRRIPSFFLGHRVVVEDMPQLSAQINAHHGLAFI